MDTQTVRCLSVAVFKMLSEFDIPYKCAYCTLQTQNRKIQQLQDTVRTLTNELASIKQNQTQQLNNEPAAATSAEPPSDIENPNTAKTLLNDQPPAGSKNHHPRDPHHAKVDRKYNVVLYGIKESSSNVSRSKRS